MRYSLLFLFAFRLYAEVSAIYLSWYSDPATTMTIQWHSSDPEDTISLSKENNWINIEGSHLLLNDVYIHKVFLEKLDPDTEYPFKIGEETYKFRTAPQTLDEPIRFVIGGDAFQRTKLFRRMNKTVAALDPLFCVIGGDIAYAIKANPLRFRDAFQRWLDFFAIWKEQMIAPDGRLIPLIPVPGNHDIAPDDYDLFFSFFAFPKKQLYRTLDFGHYLSLVLLDTGHFQPIEGQQTEWLDSALSERTTVPFRFAVYHEAAYPSFYPYNGSTPKKIRASWCPLFDQYKLQAAFENHNHTFKRTHPLKNNAIDPAGVLYLGDGSWGSNPRIPNNTWYLAKRARKNSVYLIDLTPKTAKIQAIDFQGEPIDTITLYPNN